ncbi:MAG: flavodoxin family protein [Patescibacteria group bacterium]|nr:flavodoxin family protein [Patescibacteria group bacterium]
MKIISICGSPRKGNSETIINKVDQFLKEKGVENEIVLLREKKIERCHGCVEYCNHKLKCQLHDDFDEVADKFEKADGYVFACPNYFNMPPGILKDFIDRCSIFYTAGKDKEFAGKKAIVVCVGAESPEETKICTTNVADNFCRLIGMNVVGTKSLKSKSELNGNMNDIFENGFNPSLEKELKELVEELMI